MCYTFEDFSRELLSSLEISQKVIGITGPSCVGKSTLAAFIDKNANDYYKTSTIHVDNYLRDKFRGKFEFRNNVDQLLSPCHFDWAKLCSDIVRLQNKESVTIPVYTRGEGWGNTQTMVPSDLLIIEGLFMDSVEASKYLSLDLLILLKAEREFLYNNRKKRDKMCFASFRNERETQTETLRTFFADNYYYRANCSSAYIEALVMDSYTLKILDIKQGLF